MFYPEVYPHPSSPTLLAAPKQLVAPKRSDDGSVGGSITSFPQPLLGLTRYHSVTLNNGQSRSVTPHFFRAILTPSVKFADPCSYLHILALTVFPRVLFLLRSVLRSGVQGSASVGRLPFSAGFPFQHFSILGFQLSCRAKAMRRRISISAFCFLLSEFLLLRHSPLFRLRSPCRIAVGTRSHWFSPVNTRNRSTPA